jgi:hypothetical protein
MSSMRASTPPLLLLRLLLLRLLLRVRVTS